MLFHSVKTNDWVRSKINFPVGPQEPLLATVKTQKLAQFRHVTCHNSSKNILQDTLGGGRCPGRQRKCWMDHIQECYRKDWKRISAESSSMFLPPPPPSSNLISQGTELNIQSTFPMTHVQCERCLFWQWLQML